MKKAVLKMVMIVMSLPTMMAMPPLNFISENLGLSYRD